MKKREHIGAMRNGKVYFFNVLTTKTIDMVTWGQMYKSGYREPRFPVPAIRYSEELVHSMDGETVHFLLMYRHPTKAGYCKVVGDSPQMII